MSKDPSRTGSISTLERIERHREAFIERFGPGGGVRLFFSPGRINLMGAHLDYNGGPVMPTAIDRGTFIAARERGDARFRLGSTLDASITTAGIEALPEAKLGGWSDYPLGVLVEMRALARSFGRNLRGFDVLFGGNLPVGAGLSSSASICVGTAFAIDGLCALEIERMDLVHAALRAERTFVGVQCGIMDPYAVGLARAGSLLWLDCKDATSEYIPLDPARVSVAVADTGVRRELAQGAFNLRVRQCAEAFSRLRRHQPDATCLRDIELETFHAHAGELSVECARRARHVIHEVARTFKARAALRRGDPAGFGAEMFRAHESLREHFEVSVPELDQLVASAADVPGCLGARLTGAGFGGCVVALLEKGREADVAGRMIADFEARFGSAPVVAFFGGDAGPREIT